MSVIVWHDCNHKHPLIWSQVNATGNRLNMAAMWSAICLCIICLVCDSGSSALPPATPPPTILTHTPQVMFIGLARLHTGLRRVQGDVRVPRGRERMDLTPPQFSFVYSSLQLMFEVRSRILLCCSSWADEWIVRDRLCYVDTCRLICPTGNYRRHIKMLMVKTEVAEDLRWVKVQKRLIQQFL